MAKFFETSEDVVELINKKFEATGLSNFVSLKIISTTKAKEILKIKKGSPETNFIAKNRADVCLFVYQDAFDRLTDDIKEKMVEGVLSNVSYNDEKDKVEVENSRYGEAIRMARKYDDYLNVVETGYIVIQQIIEEEKERKAAEKEAKKNK